MNVYWLEQTDADLPAENQWLSAGEIVTLGRMRFAQRRNDWRLGRWTAKRALATCLRLPSDLPALADIEIRAAASGAPEAFLFNQSAPVAISLSHRAGIGMCAVAVSGADIGCDLEMIEPRSDAFVADYFTPNEQALVERTLVESRPLLVNLLWSTKESALKALHAGLRLDTNCMDVALVDGLPPRTEESRQDLPPISISNADPSVWHPLYVRYSRDQVFCGWWQHTNQMVRTVVSTIPLPSPIHSTSVSSEIASLR